MNILVLGDIHGRTIWKEIIQVKDWDRIIITGDYFDPYELIPKDEMIKNFEELVQFKMDQEDREKVILLFGNHDLHYTRFIHERWGRYDRRLAPVLKSMIEELIEERVLDLMWYEESEDLLFSHAGLSYYWYSRSVLGNGNERVPSTYDSFLKTWNFTKEQFKNLVNELNTRFWNMDSEFMQSLGFVSADRWDVYGTDPTNSPLWIRLEGLGKTEIVVDSKLITQVVGHTQFEYPFLLDQGRILVVDTLGRKHYTSIEDGEVFNRYESVAETLGKLNQVKGERK